MGLGGIGVSEQCGTLPVCDEGRTGSGSGCESVRIVRLFFRLSLRRGRFACYWRSGGGIDFEEDVKYFVIFQNGDF